MQKENELLKQINRELKVSSLEREESKKDKSEESKETIDNIDTSTSEEIVNIAEDKVDDVVDDLKVNVLSSSVSDLENEEKPIIRNDIDDVEDKSGILNKDKTDLTSTFVEPDETDDKAERFKVVDTALGTFTILNQDSENVLLMDSNKQKIQISIKDFNNLKPFEIKDDTLSNINSFTDAYKKDLSDKERESQQTMENGTEHEKGDIEDEFVEEDIEESVSRGNKNNNIITKIQSNLSKRKGVVETIRSDLKSKNRCVLNARQTKRCISEVTLSSRNSELSKRTIRDNVMPKRNNEKLMEKSLKRNKKNEITEPGSIYVAPKAIGDIIKPDDNFNVDKVLTFKDGKFTYVKLEGKEKIAYLKLKLKNNESNISIKEFDNKLHLVKSFYESLDYLENKFSLLEKEVVMKKYNKFESEENKEIETEDVEVEDEEIEDQLDDKEVDVDADSEVEEEEVEEEEPESIEFSTEINGVVYKGILHAVVNEESDEDEEFEDKDDDDESEYDDVEDIGDLLLQDDDEIQFLDIEDETDDEIVTEARIFGSKFNVSFSGLKKDSIRKAKNELRKSNKAEAWNILVKGAKSIKC